MTAERYDLFDVLADKEVERAKKESKAIDIAVEVREKYTKDEYGGMYIDENQELHVLVTSDIFQKSLSKELKTNTKYHIDKAKFSLKELECQYEIISDLLINQKNNYREVYIDEELNRVIVNLLYGEKYSKQLISLVSDEIFVVEYGEEDSEPILDIAVGPGYSITTCTIGYPAKIGSVVGFVTAGHCFKKIDDVAYNNAGIKIGVVVIRYHSNSADVAFIKRTNTNYVPSKKAVYSKETIDGSSISYLTQGATIHLEGIISKHQTGTVTSTSTTVGNYTKRIRSTYKATGGDSGGTLWIGKYIPGTNVYARYIVGIHNGHTEVLGQYGFAFGMRIDEIHFWLTDVYYGG